VNAILTNSLNAYLSKSTFNNTAEVVATLKLIGLQTAGFSKFMSDISSCMERRHFIVHRGDRPDYSLTTHGPPKGISASDVSRWHRSISEFGTKLLSQLNQPKRK
jgi:hypothetical protein